MALSRWRNGATQLLVQILSWSSTFLMWWITTKWWMEPNPSWWKEALTFTSMELLLFCWFCYSSVYIYKTGSRLPISSDSSILTANDIWLIHRNSLLLDEPVYFTYHFIISTLPNLYLNYAKDQIFFLLLLTCCHDGHEYSIYLYLTYLSHRPSPISLSSLIAFINLILGLPLPHLPGSSIAILSVLRYRHYWITLDRKASKS